MDNWYVYIIDKRGKLYVGITTNLENRIRQHGRTDPLHTEGPTSRTEAAKRERQIKGWTRKKKFGLIKNAFSKQQ